MCALPGANLRLRATNPSAYLLPFKDGYNGWLQPGSALYPRAVQVFLPASSMNAYSRSGGVVRHPVPSAGAVVRHPVPSSGVVVRHPVSSGTVVGHPVSSGTVVRQAVSSGGVGRYPVSPGTTVRHSVSSGTVARHPVSSDGALVRQTVSSGTVARHPVSSGGDVVRQQVSSGGDVVRHPVSSGGAVVRQPVSSGGALVRHPVSSGGVVRHLVSSGVDTRAINPASASPATLVYYPTSSGVTLMHSGKQAGAMSNSGQRMPHPVNNSRQCPKIAQLCVNANSDSPVDLSVHSRKNLPSKKQQKQIPELNSGFRPQIQSSSVSGEISMAAPSSVPATSVVQAKTMQSTYMLCRYCPFKAHSKEQIQGHILSSHPQRVVVVPKTFTCNYCTYVTSSELCMVRHLLTSHRPKILPSRVGNMGIGNLFSCSVCVFSADEPTMIKHMLDHYKDSTPCNGCTSCVNWNQPVLVNRKRKLPTQKSAGVRGVKKANSNSAKSSKSTESLPTSQNSQPSKILMLKCAICETQFLTKDQLQTHQLSHTSSPLLSFGHNSVHNKASETESLPATTQSTSSTVAHTTTEIWSLKPSHVEPTTANLLTPPSSECEGLAGELPTILTLPELQSSSVSDDVVANTTHPLSSVTLAHSTSSICAVDATTGCDAKVTGSTTMPAANSRPTKKRKLAMKIFKNNSGEYESKRADTPMSFSVVSSKEDNVLEAISSEPLTLCVQVPLGVLPSRQHFSATKDGQDKDIQSPTRLQIPFDILPKGKQLSAIALKIGDSNDLPSIIPEDTVGVISSKTGSPTNGLTRLSPVSEVEKQGNATTSEANTILHSTSSQVNFNQMSIEINHALGKTNQPQENTNNPNPTQVLPVMIKQGNHSQDTLYKAESFSDTKNGKMMANKLKEKLSNIHLRSRQGSDLSSNDSNSPTAVNSQNSVEEKDEATICDTVEERATICDSLVTSAPMADKTRPALSRNNDSLERGVCIDQTIKNSTDENSDVDRNKMISLKKECHVKVTNISLELQPDAVESVLRTENGLEEINITNTDIQVQPQETVGLPLFSVNAELDGDANDNVNPAAVDAKESSNDSNSKQSESKPLPQPKLVKRHKTARRNALRLPSMIGSHNVNSLDSEDLVICPFCPKRLLFRLLPAHVQFHGSDCEHRCRDCNFATSFKWVLDTHVLCHKELAHVDARQITEIEWKNMKDETLSDNEEVEMTQRLLIREEPAVPMVPSKRQIARKTIVKKTTNALPAATHKKGLPNASPGPVAESPAPLPVNKTKAHCMEDFFAQILTERVQHK